MKQYWLKLSARLDGMTLRERVTVFAGALAALLFVLYTVSIEPLLLRQKQLLAQISQQDNQIAGIDNEIIAKVAAHGVDPDAAVRTRMQTVQAEVASNTATLMALQKGLVAPDKIAPLLDQLLRGHGKLQLVSMRSLPVAGLSEALAPEPPSAKPAAAPLATGLTAVTAAAAVPPPAVVPPAAVPSAAKPAKTRELLYRHGVELVLQGSYLDMVSYMAALEGLPAQLFWGRARLDVMQYPDARLTLTLYTLSLDQKWMKL